MFFSSYFADVGLLEERNLFGMIVLLYMLFSLSRIFSINDWRADALFPLRSFCTPGSI